MFPDPLFDSRLESGTIRRHHKRGMTLSTGKTAQFAGQSSLYGAIMLSKNRAICEFSCLFWHRLFYLQLTGVGFCYEVGYWRGIQAYDSKKKGQRNFFDFHFQVKDSIFPQHPKVVDDSNFYPIFKKGGVFSVLLFWATPKPHLSSALLPQQPFSIAILGLLSFNPNIWKTCC